jgi:hypothetical protein
MRARLPSRIAETMPGCLVPLKAVCDNRAEIAVESKPRTRVVLLGASNLTLSFPRVVGELRSQMRAPIEILAALGHGRSYGTSSSVLFRELPGIDACGLWTALEAARPSRTLALLTDLGNDIAYGREVDEIAAWIERCLARLAAAGARTALVRMPVEVVEEIGELRFRVAKGVIFPGRRIDLATVRTRVRALDERVLALARERSLTMVEQPPSWFGFDPIHILRSRRAEAWRTFLKALVPEDGGVSPGRLSPADRRSVRRARPQWRRYFGREQRRDQPSAQLLDGTTIALY